MARLLRRFGGNVAEEVAVGCQREALWAGQGPWVTPSENDTSFPRDSRGEEEPSIRAGARPSGPGTSPDPLSRAVGGGGRHGGGVDVKQVISKLYGLKPAEFIAARDACVAQARQEEDAAAARRITALRKPDRKSVV